MPDKLKRKERNCDCENEGIKFEWDNELKRCPKSQITREVTMLVNWYQDFRGFGLLPYGGSDLMSQPAYVLEAFRVCSYEMSLIDSERVAK